MPSSAIKAEQEISDYIENIQPFAKAICTRLRQIMFEAVPGIKEEWKWGPNYNYQGMVCGFGGFQKHVKLTFFNGSAMSDSRKLFNHCVDNEFNRSIKFTDVNEIDENILKEYIQESAEINKNGWKREIKHKDIEIPGDLREALQRTSDAEKFFNALPFGCKKEYVEWITTAKQEKTRNDRIAKTVVMCAEGRKMNDKYKK